MGVRVLKVETGVYDTRRGVFIKGNPRGIWPIGYEIDEGIWYGAVHAALKNRNLSAAQVEKAADDLIDDLYGRNAIVEPSQVKHIHTLFRNSYADAREMRISELRKLAAKRAEHLKSIAGNPGRRNPAGYQVWSSSWSGLTRRIPDRLLFGGRVFPTKKAAEDAWYDTDPGRNDHFVVLKAGAKAR